MLIGEYKHTLDPKKRLALPAKVRKDLGDVVILTKGLDTCLSVYPHAEWEKVMAKFSQLSEGQAGTRSFVRMMLAGAVEAEVDDLGRILVPDYLKEYAGLEKDVVVVGIQNRLEIWDKTKWETYKSEAERSTGTVAEKLGELGVY